MNENLMQQPVGPGMQFALDLGGSSLGSMSDNVEEGNYELFVVSAQAVPKKGGKPGLNMKLAYKVCGPQCPQLGRQIVVHHPIPQGDKSLEDTRKQGALLTRCVHAILAHAGQISDDGSKGNPGEIMLTPEWFREKKLYAYVISEPLPNSTQVAGTVRHYLGREQFTAAPGPVGQPLAQQPPAQQPPAAPPPAYQPPVQPPANPAAAFMGMGGLPTAPQQPGPQFRPGNPTGM